MLRSASQIVVDAYGLIRPYGRKRLAVVLVVVLAQALAQAASVFSIFPFLAVAANPEQFANSGVGAWLIAHVPGLSASNLLVWAGGFALAMLVLTNSLSALGEYVRARFTMSFAHWLRMRLVRHYAAQPYAYHLERNSSVLVKKAVGDVNQFAKGVLMPSLEVVSRLCIAVLLLVVLLSVDPLATLVVGLVGGVFYGFMFVVLRRRRSEVSRGLKAAIRETFRSLTQMLGGIKQVLVQGREVYFIGTLEAPSQTQARLEMKMPIYSNVPRYLIEPVAFGAIVVVVLVLSEDMTQLVAALPVLGLFAFAGYRLLPTLQLMYAQLTAITAQRYALEEVREELADVPGDSHKVKWIDRPEASPFDWKEAIRFEHVGFAYTQSDKLVLEDIDLVIPKNSSAAFVGPTGSGKSTIVDLILGLHTPTLGSIYIDDTRLAGRVVRSWRKIVGYVPQDIYLLDDSIRRNIAFGVPDSDIDMERIRWCAQSAQIGTFIERELPLAYDTQVGERGVRLSGGQRQRIALARALYTDPQLLVLDEATSALDNKTEAEFMKVVSGLKSMVTVIVIAHRLSTVQGMDTVFHLENGRMLGKGTYDELMESLPAFRELAHA